MRKRQTIKSYILLLSPRKREIWLFFFILSPITILIVLHWLFTLQGTKDLYLYFKPFNLVIILSIIFAIVLPIIALIDIFTAINHPSKHRPRRIIWVLFFISIIFPLGVFIVIQISLNHPAGSTSPQLLICDGSGEYGIPNMGVTFWTQQKSKNSFQWGFNSSTFTEEEMTSRHQHSFLLNDLLPETEYWYQISNKGEIFSFKTPPHTNNTLKFAIGSDPHFNIFTKDKGLTIQFLEQIIDPTNNYDIFFMLGDFANLGFLDYCWKEGLNMISPYTSQIPFRPIIGNHDSLFGGLKYYLDYFYPEDLPVQTGSRFWYRIDVNNIHFFLLHLEWGIETYTAAQQEWFEEQLMTIPENDWTIVMSHSVYDFSNIILESPFLMNKIDLIFSGHTHSVEIEEKSGILFSKVGVFGDNSITGFMEGDWYGTSTGYMEVVISGNKAELTFRNQFNDSLYNTTFKK